MKKNTTKPPKLGERNNVTVCNRHHETGLHKVTSLGRQSTTEVGEVPGLSLRRQHARNLLPPGDGGDGFSPPLIVPD